MDILEILKISNGTIICECGNNIINKVRIDSRKIKNNDAFLTINSGYKYIDDAIKNGASTIITDKDITLSNVNVIKVDNTLSFLYSLATYNRLKYKPIVIAITGSVGKTTTKELIYNFLEKDYNVLKNINNENNIIGVSKTLLNIDENVDIVVLEAGTNHFGELHEISKVIKPDIAIITNIGSSHIGNFKSKKNIFKAKMELLDGMNNGILIINNDSKYLKRIKYLDNIGIYKVGTSGNYLDLKAFDIKKENDRVSFLIEMDGIKYKLYSKTKMMIPNILIATLLGSIFDIDNNYIIDTVNNYEGFTKRMEIIDINDTKIINDSYNSSLESCKNAFSYLEDINKDKIIILGDILELGKYSKKIHRKLGRLLRKFKNTKILVIGKYTKEINKINKKNSIYLENKEKLKEYLKDLDLFNKTILIKGSRAFKLEEISNYIIDLLNKN